MIQIQNEVNVTYAWRTGANMLSALCDVCH